MPVSKLIDVCGRHAMTCPRLTCALAKEHMLKKWLNFELMNL